MNKHLFINRRIQIMIISGIKCKIRLHQKYMKPETQIHLHEYMCKVAAVFVIIPEITTLHQYIEALSQASEVLRPEACPKCGLDQFICKGSYPRKPNYTKLPLAERLGPIDILRYYCKICCMTFSALPECIPPHRHYIWTEQQATIEPVLQGASYRQVSEIRKPSRWTISRWMGRLVEQAKVHLDTFRARFPELGRINDFATSWLYLLAQRSLAQLMRFLHQANVVIP